MTHCRICGVLEDVGESVICEDCADNQNASAVSDYFSWYDIACAALVLGLVILVIDTAVVIVSVVMGR